MAPLEERMTIIIITSFAMLIKSGYPHAGVSGAGARVDDNGNSGRLFRVDSRLNLAARLGALPARPLRPLSGEG
jgi:hypothetical protein